MHNGYFDECGINDNVYYGCGQFIIMKSFKTFIEKTPRKKAVELHDKTHNLFPTLVKHKIMREVDETRFMLTEKGSNAFTFLMRKIVFNSDTPELYQDSLFELQGYMRFDDKNNYTITNEALYGILMYLLYCGKTDEEIVEMIKEYWE